MNKLSGTSGQLFSVLAGSINSGGTARSGKGSGGQATEDSSFHDLLHTVSNLAKRALSDQGNGGSMKSAALRAQVAQLAERDAPRDEAVQAVREHTKAAAEPEPSNKPGPIDHTVKSDVQGQLTAPSIVGQQLAVVAALRPQAQPLGSDPGAASGRAERPATGRDLPGASATMPAVGEARTRPSDAVPQGAVALHSDRAAPTTTSIGSSTASGSGFDAIAASVERVAKFNGRDALPEVTKVSVLQQETHLPPVPQFTATQQVANAVVTELNGSPAPASSAATDLASAQGKAPDQPLKILTISLDPPALGNVTVRLRLAGDAVSVHLAADRRDTSQLLEQQRDSIRELMRSAGYTADIAPVQHGTLDGLPAGSGQSQASLPGQQQSSQGMPDNFSPSSGQPQGGARQARQEGQHDQETRHEQDVVSRNGRGTVYL